MSLYEKEGRCSDEKSAEERKKENSAEKGLNGQVYREVLIGGLGWRVTSDDRHKRRLSEIRFPDCQVALPEPSTLGPSHKSVP